VKYQNQSLRKTLGMIHLADKKCKRESFEGGGLFQPGTVSRTQEEREIRSKSPGDRDGRWFWGGDQENRRWGEDNVLPSIGGYRSGNEAAQCKLVRPRDGKGGTSTLQETTQGN